MKTRFSTALVCLAGLASAALAGPPGEWYNGDADRQNGLACESNTFTPGFISMVYENFDHLGGDITDVWGNFYSNTGVQGVFWEIRSGMGPGNGGSLIANGYSTAGNGELAISQNGWNDFGFTGFHMDLDIPDVADPGLGQYWLGLSVDGNQTGRVFVQKADGGINAIGSPVNDSKALFHSPNVFGTNYADALQSVGQGNFSMGVNARVPGPASAALLGLGGLVAGRRRR